MQRSAQNLHLPRMGHVGAREIDVEQDVVLFDRRTQQERPLSIDGQLKSRQKTCPFVVETVRAGSEGMDVAVLIEQPERIALLQHLDGVIGQRRRSSNVAWFIRTIDLSHESLSSGP